VIPPKSRGPAIPKQQPIPRIRVPDGKKDRIRTGIFVHAVSCPGDASGGVALLSRILPWYDPPACGNCAGELSFVRKIEPYDGYIQSEYAASGMPAKNPGCEVS